MDHFAIFLERIAVCKPLFTKNKLFTPLEWPCGKNNEVFCSKNLASVGGIKIFNWK